LQLLEISSNLLLEKRDFRNHVFCCKRSIIDDMHHHIYNKPLRRIDVFACGERFLSHTYWLSSWLRFGARSSFH